MGTWTPGDVAAMATALTQIVLAIAALRAIVTTKAEVSSVRKDVDGRFSQLLDLIGRLSNAPDRRASDDRRSSNGAATDVSPPGRGERA